MMSLTLGTLLLLVPVLYAQNHNLSHHRYLDEDEESCDVFYYDAEIKVHVNGNPACDHFDKEEVGMELDYVFDKAMKNVDIEGLNLKAPQTSICAAPNKVFSSVISSGPSATSNNDNQEQEIASFVINHCQDLLMAFDSKHNAQCGRSFQCRIGKQPCCTRRSEFICRCHKNKKPKCYRQRSCRCDRMLQQHGKAAHNHDEQEDKDHHVRLLSAWGEFIYRGNGRCRLCTADNRDDRSLIYFNAKELMKKYPEINGSSNSVSASSISKGEGNGSDGLSATARSSTTISNGGDVESNFQFQGSGGNKDDLIKLLSEQLSKHLTRHIGGKFGRDEFHCFYQRQIDVKVQLTEAKESASGLNC